MADKDLIFANIKSEVSSYICIGVNTGREQRIMHPDMLNRVSNDCTDAIMEILEKAGITWK